MDSTMHTSSSVPSFVFPLLKPSEIRQCMSELGMPMSQSELAEPARHKEKLRKVYLFLLDACAGKSEEDLQADNTKLEEAAAAVTDFPELHAAENFSELAFFEALRDLFLICGYNQFSWRDLYAPEQSRLRYQLSAILNLAKFREEQLKVYHELNEPRAQMIQTLEELNQEQLELEKQLEISEKESESKLHEMEEVVQECQELELEIARNNRLQSTAREQAAALKKKANDLKDELATVDWALQEAEAEEERLRAAVVSSPDRRKAEVAYRRQRLDSTKEECALLERQVQEAKTKTLTAQKLKKDFESTTITLDDLQKQATEYSQLVQNLESTRQQISQHEKQAAEIHQSIEQADREQQRTEKAMVHQREQQALQMRALQEALDDAKSQLLAVEKDRREGMARIEAGEAQVRQLEAAMEEERRATEAELQGMIADYHETERVFLERHAKRMAVIESGIATS